jgi:CRISPR-associated endonuclease/helicase Cas3
MLGGGNVSGVSLPALVGLDPVGFLAALGVVRVLGHRRADVRLAFDPVTAQAVVHGVKDVDQVVDELVAAFEGMPDGQLMVGLPPAFVPKPEKGADFKDPARITPQEFRERAATAATLEERAWIRAIWSDLGGEDGECASTPFYAPTGRQTLWTTFSKPWEAVNASARERLTEALVAWRRFEKFTGENLDIRAVRGAADQADGVATMAGVPGATWLALAAIPFFPMGGDGRRARTVGWFELRAPRDRRRPWFAWPVWRHPLDADAIAVLLRHDVVRDGARLAVEKSESADAKRRGERWRAQARALGVERVVAARRRQLPGGKSAGVLVPYASMS